MVIKYLYHGSSKKLIRDKLIPKKPTDLGKRKRDIRRGIYASDKKEIAIAMAMISCKGVEYSSLSFNKKPFGTIYKGKPQQTYVYLYTLFSDKFKKIGKDEWISSVPIKPIKIEKLKIKDYINLIRKATKEEKERWFKKYGN